MEMPANYSVCPEVQSSYASAEYKDHKCTTRYGKLKRDTKSTIRTLRTCEEANEDNPRRNTQKTTKKKSPNFFKRIVKDYFDADKPL